MSTSTDVKIKELFERAAAAEDEAELKRIERDLRAAIAEHAGVGRRSPVSKRGPAAHHGVLCCCTVTW